MNPLKWIIAYLFGRGAFALFAGVSCLMVALSWLDDAARTWGIQLGLHAVTGAWLELARAFSNTDESKLLVLIGLAFLFDAALVFVEGLSLWVGWWWARWLVVISSTALLPFELIALARDLSVSRLLLVLLNVAVAWWLFRHKLSPASGLSRPPVAVT